MPNVTFGGEDFRTADKIGLMPLMRFAKVAKQGVDAEDLDGLAALYDLLEQCIHDDEWTRFQETADRTRADGEELMAVIGKVFEALAARPTSLPSDSSAGQPTTQPRSESVDTSYLQVVKRLEQQGRPDQALIVAQANRDRSLVSAS